MLTYACGTFLIDNMRDIFIAEVAKRGKNRVRCSLSEAAERRGLDVMCKLFEAVEVRKLALAGDDAVEDLKHALGTDTAGRALAAGLIDGEVEEEARDIDHAVVLVHDDQTAGAHHRADGDQVVIVDRRVDQACGDAAAGRTAGLRSLELSAVRDAAADLFDDLAERGAHRDLHKTGVGDLAAEREDLRALRLFGTHGREPVGALQDDLRNVCISLNVVEDGRLAEQTLDSREWRSWSWFTSVAFNRCHKGCFLTTDESTCTKSQINIKIKS